MIKKAILGAQREFSCNNALIRNGLRNSGRDLAALAPVSAAVIDIGGGHGAFLRHLKARGFSNLALHEIPGGELPDLAGIVRAVYRDDDCASLPSEAFNVVTMMDVMEHVPDVDAAFAAARRVLRPRGILYLHTPVVTRLDRAMHAVQKMPLLGGIGRAWQRSRTSVFHLQNLTPRALRMLADRHGFEVTRLDCVNELSWPVPRYVRVYLVEKAALPRALAPLAALLIAPLLRSRLNANKGVLAARARDERGSAQL